MTKPSLEKGADIIRAAAKTAPDTPGVYRMIGAREEVLYVGKAKSIRRRVLSYAQAARLPERLRRMVAQTERMEFIHTHTEAEALLLEANLIKKLKPYFNVLLRDDKSFPYLFIPAGHDFPTILKHRGARNAKGEYFGPFASAGDVNRVLITLQRAFKLRNCTDNYFAQRRRPCLQYHIKRCDAPCVGLIGKEAYAESLAEARAFLQGKSREIQNRMTKAMEAASAEQDYETASVYRDKIRALTYVQSTQDVAIKGLGDADVFALAEQGGRSCVQVFFFRGGQNFGNRAYFPRHAPDEPPESILGAFIAQFYQSRPAPVEIIVSHALAEKTLLEEALSQTSQANVKILSPKGGGRARAVAFARNNARAALERQAAESASGRALMEKVAKFLDLIEPPARIEVYDNSHTGGTNMTGAMIVAGIEGFRKNSYRKFNIRAADASDDYGMMREVLTRRFARALKEDATGEDWPDVALIDGGLGQFNAANDVLTELGVLDSVTVVAIAKGPDRHAGRERFFTKRKRDFILPPGDPVLHYFQRLRDEAHRFAISSHRARRAKDAVRSGLDDAPGIGAARKKALLRHFGSAKAVAEAGIEDLKKVEGISAATARKIYDFFHGG